MTAVISAYFLAIQKHSYPGTHNCLHTQKESWKEVGRVILWSCRPRGRKYLGCKYTRNGKTRGCKEETRDFVCSLCSAHQKLLWKKPVRPGANTQHLTKCTALSAQKQSSLCSKRRRVRGPKSQTVTPGARGSEVSLCWKYRSCKVYPRPAEKTALFA